METETISSYQNTMFLIKHRPLNIGMRFLAESFGCLNLNFWDQMFLVFACILRFLKKFTYEKIYIFFKKIKKIFTMFQSIIKCFLLMNTA